MKKIALLILIVFVFLMSSCWDQNLLKDLHLIKAAGYDQLEDGNLKTIFVTSSKKKQENLIMTAIGVTPRGTRQNIDNKTGEKTDASKMRVLIFGKEIAEGGIYPLLDIFYRDPKSSLSAKVAVSDSTAADVLQLKKSSGIIYEYLSDIIQTGMERTIFPDYSIQTICPFFFDDGQDILLPLLTEADDSSAEMKGLAMFNNDKMTGTLTIPEASLFLIMNNQEGAEVTMIKEVLPTQDKFRKYITINIHKARNTMEIEVDQERIKKIGLNLDLQVEVIEFPHDNLKTHAQVEELNRKLTEELTKEAKVFIKKMQEAKCDGFGIGRVIQSKHKELWKQLSWKDDVYPNLLIEPTIQVDIIQHGIIN